MRHHLIAAVLPLGFVACTSDLSAPRDYEDTDSIGGNTGTQGGPLAFECPPLTSALGAELDVTLEANGGNGGYTWSSEDLPEGLQLDETSGTLTGSPQDTGNAEFEVTVTDDASESVTQACELSVAPRLQATPALDLELPFCLQPGGDTLLDLIVDGTGDGTPIVCDAPGGNGNGRAPAGISVNEDCEIEGEIEDERFGTTVFMVRGSQSGAEVWVPYCVTQEHPDTQYAVSVQHQSAGKGVEAVYVPFLQRFDPDNEVAVGIDESLRFEVSEPSACGATCFFGFAFSLNASPFDADTFTLDPSGLLEDSDEEPIGLFHELSIEGDEVSDSFKNRPWVLNVSIDYCLADDREICNCPADDDDCNRSQRVRENGDGNLEFGIIMVPQ